MTRATATRNAPAQVWAHRNLILNLAQRDLKAKYKKSVLGWVWSLLNPAASLAVYTLVFGLFLKGRAPVAGNGELQNFALYLFAGLIVWNLFANSLTGALGALEGAAPLLTKIYFPPECPAIASVAGVVLQSFIEAGIIVTILVVMGNASPTMLLIPVLFAQVTLLSIGLGMWLSVLNIRYRDVQYLVVIALQVAFYCTPIVYSSSLIPEESHGIPVRRLLLLNPIARFVDAFRDLVYNLRVPALTDWLYLTAVPVAVFVLSWTWFRRAAAGVIEEL